MNERNVNELDPTGVQSKYICHDHKTQNDTELVLFIQIFILPQDSSSLDDADL